jgi:hypothetical protein
MELEKELVPSQPTTYAKHHIYRKSSSKEILSPTLTLKSALKRNGSFSSKDRDETPSPLRFS